MFNYRMEYPRPQMVRQDWICLNGKWQFEFDFGKSGKARGMLEKAAYDKEINVPFCPESSLSGIGHVDFINAVWYKREFVLPEEWSGRVLLHFEAVDYKAEVYVNGEKVGEHVGGYTPFCFDITKHVKAENTVIVYAEDDTRTGKQPCGKQSKIYNSAGCDYTRVTGIWQSVWLEHVPQTYITHYKAVPDISNNCVNLTVFFNEAVSKKTIAAFANYGGKEMGGVKAVTCNNSVQMCLPLNELHLWEPENGRLYDLEITAFTAADTDKVGGYFGMREVSVSDNCILINSKPVFQRLVLDQGFYPDGIYTAPSDEALVKDIELSMALGYNGARLHQKVFERRFIYHADRLGYMVWGEFGNWGLDHSREDALAIFLPQWLESVARDFNSPALVGWCPFNETWDINGRQQIDSLLANVYLATKAADTTRPVIDTSGNYHVMTDIYDVHEYTQEPDKFAEFFEPMKNGGEVYNTFPHRQQYNGKPYFVSEYGGIWWQPNADGWGYGSRPQSEQEYIDRYAALTSTLLQNPRICALCYTQLYDIEQEVNGLYNYDRTPKFNKEQMEALAAAMRAKAAIEE